MLIGGFQNSDGESSQLPQGGMLLFDLAAGQWVANSRASMSTARSDFCAAVVDDVIYAAGGAGPEGDPLDSIEAYDWDADEWAVVG